MNGLWRAPYWDIQRQNLRTASTIGLGIWVSWNVACTFPTRTHDFLLCWRSTTSAARVCPPIPRTELHQCLRLHRVCGGTGFYIFLKRAKGGSATCTQPAGLSLKETRLITSQAEVGRSRASLSSATHLRTTDRRHLQVFQPAPGPPAPSTVTTSSLPPLSHHLKRLDHQHHQRHHRHYHHHHHHHHHRRDHRRRGNNASEFSAFMAILVTTILVQPSRLPCLRHLRPRTAGPHPRGTP